MSKALGIEAYRQKELYNSIVGDGWTLAEDPANLEPYIGKVIKIDVKLVEITPGLLAKLFIKGTENHENSFMLIPLWQILKYNKINPQVGDEFKGTFAVGVRRILKERAYVFALRLPRG